MMTRTDRLLRLAKLRGDRAAVAILMGHIVGGKALPIYQATKVAERFEANRIDWTEAELRAAWGDR